MDMVKVGTNDGEKQSKLAKRREAYARRQKNLSNTEKAALLLKRRQSYAARRSKVSIHTESLHSETKSSQVTTAETHSISSCFSISAQRLEDMTTGVVKLITQHSTTAVSARLAAINTSAVYPSILIHEPTIELQTVSSSQVSSLLQREKLKGIVSKFSIYQEGETSKRTTQKSFSVTTDIALSEAEAGVRLHPSSAKQKTTQRRRFRKKHGSGISLLANIQEEADNLPDFTYCNFCGAKRFLSETSTFCCCNGDVQLQENKMPDALAELFLGKSDESIHFRKLVRTYNNMFAFTSLGVHYDKELAQKSRGVYVFKIQGQIYHFINDLIPDNGKGSFLQLYFYDTEHEVQNRMAVSDKLTEAVVLKLMQILENNPYGSFFRSLRQIPNLSLYQIVLKSHAGSDQRVFNKPTVSQVAALWIEGEKCGESSERHIRVYSQNGNSHRVQYYYGCYDPLQYPLLFPFGENGWHQGIQRYIDANPNKRKRKISEQSNMFSATELTDPAQLWNAEEQNLKKPRDNRKSVSMREYYAYKFQMRQQNGSFLLHSGRLFQQFLVDMYVKIESQRLDFYRSKQTDLRREQLQGIMDSVMQGERQASRVGKKFILPTTFIGGPRDMKRRYLDAMTLVEKFGRPDIFLTMTCNPSWPEIKQNMLDIDEVESRSDLVTRVFHAKLDRLKDELLKKQIFGEVAAYTYVIEFQKRGLPHAHFLLIMTASSKIYSVDAYDTIVCAELPNKDQFPHLYKMVVKHMIHGPCGVLNPKNVCMKSDGLCRSQYPKAWSDETKHGVNAYPIYRRRNDGRTANVRGQNLDNRWVIPYNPYVLAKFNCHINVEICSTIKVVKYIYKYIYKGHDRISMQLNSDDGQTKIDEIQDFQLSRWVSPPEAIWRIFGFALTEMRPSVIHLQLHLENYQGMIFQAQDDLHDILKNPFAKKSMLTEFFNANKFHESIRRKGYTYKEFPQHFVWQPADRVWKPRQQRDVIGRIVLANPIEGERYFLRLLLMNVRAPTSFDDLKTVNGTYVDTFHEAAMLRGLFHNNNAQEHCLEEATLFRMPYSLRRLFATILCYFPPDNPRILWNKFKDAMQEDFKHMNFHSAEQIETEALMHIANILHSMGKNINSFYLVHRLINLTNEGVDTRDVLSERNIVVSAEELHTIAKLNEEQKSAFGLVLDKVYKNKPGLFFIDGPGGTGKTFLYRALLAEVRSKGYIALATATSGVAASILPGGRTAHSRFKIPIDVSETKICNLSKQTAAAKLIAEAKLIIWDEAPMAHKASIEAVDIFLRDLMDSSLHFGGKVVVLGGDFRQVLPVIPKGGKQDFIAASLISSELWPAFDKIQLTQNMRAISDPIFINYLLRIGNGTEVTYQHSNVKIPDSILLPFTNEEDSLATLIDTVYPTFDHFSQVQDQVHINRAILTTTNDYVDDINKLLIQKFPGQNREYISQDTTINSSDQAVYEDFLNGLTPNGFPAHCLVLKVNAPIILLRNIDPAEGLCNGTRLICRNLGVHIIDAVIANGEYAGKQVFLHRILFRVSNEDISGIPFQRLQFPVRLCFAMTINKAQGQTLDYVGIYLRQPVFSHGQLYVALSRARNSSSVKILIRPDFIDSITHGYTKNIVYDEVLRIAHHTYLSYK